MRKLINTIEFIGRNGVAGFAKEAFYRTWDYGCDRFFGVETAGEVSKETLGLQDGDSEEYSAVSYRHLFAVLRNLPVRKEESTLLDYGCGKGRMLVAAAAGGFRKVIGVELSGLILTCRKNVDRMNHRKTAEIELHYCDAADYAVPPEVNVIYFFNPFRGELLRKVAEKIRKSHAKSPREIHIIFFNNDAFDATISGEPWLTKTRQSEVYREIACGVYRTT